jgi:hypothetical protein
MRLLEPCVASAQNVTGLQKLLEKIRASERLHCDFEILSESVPRFPQLRSLNFTSTKYPFCCVAGPGLDNEVQWLRRHLGRTQNRRFQRPAYSWMGYINLFAGLCNQLSNSIETLVLDGIPTVAVSPVEIPRTRESSSMSDSLDRLPGNLMVRRLQLGIAVAPDDVEFLFPPRPAPR